MKRKGETFTEFLTAATVFGVMMAGLFEFMANQTQSLADIRDRDNLMYHAGRFVAVSWDKRQVNSYTCNEDNVRYNIVNEDNKNTLTVTNNNTSMTFSLRPSNETASTPESAGE